MVHDPRTVANFVLDCAEEEGAVVSHLALQKLVYFSHGLYLSRTKSPLVTGYFEAWPHGPVHPVLYETFKNAGRDAIQFRADRVDVFTGEVQVLPELDGRECRRSVRRVVEALALMSPSALRRMSHAKGSPWAIATAHDPQGSEGRGARIENDLIASRFGSHKLTVMKESHEGRSIDSGFTAEIRPRAHRSHRSRK